MEKCEKVIMIKIKMIAFTQVALRNLSQKSLSDYGEGAITLIPKLEGENRLSCSDYSVYGNSDI